MLSVSLRSCYYYHHPSLSLSRSRSALKTLSSFLVSTKPFSSKNPNLTMSKPPSAFDALMSNARAAASKKKPQSSSPNKRKTLDSNAPQNPKTAKIPNSSAPGNAVSEAKPEESSGTKQGKENGNCAQDPKLSGSEKKTKVISVEERVAQLKSKMPELKKKAGDFDPRSVASWGEGERVPFMFLCLVFDMISNESGRILITDIVCNMLRTVMVTTPDDLVPIVYLSANRIAPAHEGLELGIGDASIIKALAEAFGRTEVQVKKQYQVLGDLGLVAKASRSSQSMMRKPDALTVTKVFNTFQLIAKESGKDSQEKKKNHIKGLLVAATDCEPQYLIRLLQAKLRIGLAEQTLLAALGQAAVYTQKDSTPPPNIQSPLEEAVKIVKQTYSLLPVYDKIVPALLSGGVWNLPKTCNFTPGVPVGPMLAKPTKTVQEIVRKFQDSEFTCEYKYDGERAQIHYMDMLSASFPSAGHSVKPHQNPNSAELPSCSSKDIQLVIQSDQGTSLVSGSCLIRPNSKRKFSSATTHSHKRGVREDDNQTELNGDSDFCKNPEVSGRKRLRKCFPSGTLRKFRMQESTHEEAEETEKYNSVGCVGTPSSRQLNLCSRKARVVVCGKYGEISNGKDVSKPAKIVPLSRILETARRCTLPKNCKTRLNSTRELRKANSTRTDLCCDKFTDLNNGSSVAICDKINLDNSTEETDKAWCSEDEQFAKSILLKENDDKREKDYIILHSNAPSQSKLKCKEIRKRSIYELTVKGNKFSSKSFPYPNMSKCTPEMKVGKILKDAEDSKRGLCKVYSNKSTEEHRCLPTSSSAAFCCVCGSSNQDDINCLLECSRCLIRVHQACYGVSKVPKGRWYCRPCRTSSKDIVCVLCGYGGGAMTRALRSRTIVKSILKAWNCEADCRHKNMISSAESLQNEQIALHSSGSGLDGNSFSVLQPENIKSSAIAVRKMDLQKQLDVEQDSPCASNIKVHNSITVGVLDSTVKQWVHMVCGLWTPGTRCPNVETMSAFDVSGASSPRANVACSLCNRSGGSCIKCRVLSCSIQFHPWCAHQKGLLQSEVEGVDNESVGFYGRCVLHATYPTTGSACDPINSEIGCQGEKEFACARTEGYKGRKRDDPQNDLYGPSKGKGGCLVPQEQLNAWIHINGQKTCAQGLPKLAISDIEHDCRKEYARYKQAKGWKHLVVYKSGIHALGLYTSRFISRGEMVVEYVGEIVGLRVADKRENEYQSGRKLQYKSACYFFRIDKEHIIDATRKGGIARFVNHSCLPNCVAKVISVRNEKKVVFFAERDIFPGEEITYDYHFNHEDEGKKIPCFCKSKNCRRFLN